MSSVFKSNVILLVLKVVRLSRVTLPDYADDKRRFIIISVTTSILIDIKFFVGVFSI